MSACKDALNTATVEEAKQINAYIVESKNALASLIGYKSKAMMNNAKKLWQGTSDPKKKKRYEKQYIIAKQKNIDHNDLYDKLLKYITDTADEFNYDKQRLSPQQLVEDWRSIFSKRLRGEITPVTIQQGQRTIKATSNLVDRIIKKRESLLKKGKINKREIFISPPEFIASHSDRFGFVLKLVNKALRLSDKDISKTSVFMTKLNKVRESLTDTLANAISDPKLAGVFNLNTASMWGLKGVGGLPFRMKGSSEDILIVGENIINGVPSYRVKGEDGKEIWVDKDDVNTNDEEIREALISLYRDELINELADGQLRNFIPSIINKNWIEDEPGPQSRAAQPEDPDFARAQAKIRQMAEARDKEDGGDRVAGVHTIEKKIKGKRWKYRYFMVKQGEGAELAEKQVPSEEYKVYLLDKSRVDAQGNIMDGTTINFVGKTYHKELFGDEVTSTEESYSQDEVNTVFDGGGFYRSESINDFGRRLNPKNGEPLDGTHTKQYVDFQKLEKPPVEEVMVDIWRVLADTRDIFGRVWEDISSKTRKLDARRAHFETKIWNRLRKEGKSDEEISAYVSELRNIGGIDSRIKYLDSGKFGHPTVQTSTTFAQKKGENYIPHLFTVPSIMKQIGQQLQALDTKIIRATESNVDGIQDERIQHLKEGKKHLETILMSIGKNEQSTKMLDLAAIPHLKHITAWTDQSERRKDDGIYQEYLSHIYRNLHRNEIIVELMQTIDMLGKVSTPSGTIPYLTNRIKIAFGDSDTRAMSVFGKETGYANLADKLNRIPSWIRGGVNFNSESAERLTKWFTTPATMRYLGAAPAAGNATQIVNQIIQVGFGTFMEAGRLYTNYRDKWEDIVQNTGVLNVLTMFSDVMMQDGDPDWNDFAFFPGTIIPSHNLAEFGRLLVKGRDNFVKNGSKDIDDLLVKMEARAQGKSKAMIRELQDISKLRKEIGQKKLEQKRGEFFDLFTLDAKQSEELVTDRFKTLIGDISDAKLKRMVAWKLSWWFEGGIPGKAFFTFTEGEKALRTKTIIMAMIDAQKRGLLSLNAADLKAGYGYDVFKTPMAVKIARNAVYNTQFGMTPPYLGEGFNGLGRAIFQYKQYPTLQMIHDYQTIKKFTDGHYGKAEGIARMSKAFAMATSMGVKKALGDKTARYNPKDPNLDHEALAMLRFTFTRVMASIVGSLIGTVPLLGAVMRRNGGLSFGMIRSAENPAIAMAMRIFIWTTLMAQGADDDDRDGKLDEIFQSFKLLLLPVLIGSLLRDAGTVNDWLED